MNGGGPRSVHIRLLVFVLAVLIPVGIASAAARGPKPTEPPGPKLTEPRADRLAATQCYGELASSPRAPVLLVTGSIVTPEEAWSSGYQKVLLERGHSVCTVGLSEHGFADAQRSVEHVVTAIRQVGHRSGRKLSVVGFSQGGFQVLFALRVWPRAASYVDDFVGLAGHYDRGSQWAREEADPRTRTPASHAYCSEHCVPWMTQHAPGSKLLGELGNRRLPPGPSYTAIGTLYDENVTPQPQANELPRGRTTRSIQIQDICPGRRYPSPGGGLPMNHVSMLGDAVGHALVLDAFDDPGAADPDRIARSVCLKTAYDGFDLAGFAPDAAEAGSRSAEPEQEVRSEPPLRCNLDPRCKDRRSWAVPLLGSARIAPAAIRSARHCPGGCRRPRAAVLRLGVHTPGRLKVRFDRMGSGQDDVTASRGRVRLAGGERSIRLSARSCRNSATGIRCRTLSPGAYRLQLETKPTDSSYWTRERALRMRVTRR